MKDGKETVLQVGDHQGLEWELAAGTEHGEAGKDRAARSNGSLHLRGTLHPTSILIQYPLTS